MKDTSPSLIIGQATDKHYFVIHLARTPSSLSPKSKYNSIMALLQGKFDSAGVNPFKNVFVIPENSIVDHARLVTRMLPGGMRVLGVFLVGKINMVLAMKHHLMSLLKSVNRDVMKSFCLINGRLWEDCETLCKVAEVKRSKCDQERHWACNQMAVVLVLPCDHEQQEEVEITPCSSGLCIKGNLGSSVFMHDKTTVCEVVTAIKQDIVRSLASRFEIYCDYFLEQKGFSQEYTVLHNPPKRVFIPLPGSVVTFSDYLFPEDRQAETFISFHKVLDVNVESEGIVDFEDNAHVSIEVNVSNTNIVVNENERMSTVSGVDMDIFVGLSSTPAHNVEIATVRGGRVTRDSTERIVLRVLAPAHHSPLRD
ncbi:unnamed protein product [Timema podura]|uniref:Uncharacterized protein n=1 Tax=Timema podura TaxID=61482 RepID=A0ABN7NZ57_TIMPD|nr:unnamed protein product [Timema podura]